MNAPAIIILYTMASGLMLILIKWIVMGRLKEGYFGLWSAKFAQRWIVRQCCRTYFEYTPWKYMTETGLITFLQRCLGCNIGEDSYIRSDCIEEFDLVSIGDACSADGYLGKVSLGVLSVFPIYIGSDCTIGLNSVIETGSSLQDHVCVGPKGLVTKNSILGKIFMERKTLGKGRS